MRTKKQKKSQMRSWTILSLTVMASILKRLEEKYIRNWSMKVHISQIRWEMQQLLERIRNQKKIDPDNYLNNFYYDLNDPTQKM